MSSSSAAVGASKKSTSISAPDILGRSQNWLQKVSSIRVSNRRLGQHLTSFLGDKDSGSQAPKQKHLTNDVFSPLFCKVFKPKRDGYLVFLGGQQGVRIWWTSGHSKGEFTTDLLYDSTMEDDELICVDVCFRQDSSHEAKLYLLSASSSQMNEYKYAIRPLVVTDDAKNASTQLPQVARLADDHTFQGHAKHIHCTQHYLLVTLLNNGSVQIIDRHGWQLAGEVPSLGPRRPVVAASSSRWIAVQTPKESVSAMHNDSKETSSSSSTDVGEAARRVVTGLYSFSKAVSAAVKQSQRSHKNKNNKSNDESESDQEKDDGVSGGGVLVLDLGTQCTGREGNSFDPDDFAVRAHFAAHAVDIGAMTFSPSGLKLASADSYGQVVLVHSLVISGVLCRAHPVVAPGYLKKSDRYHDMVHSPQVLFKLVRGWSLSSIVDIGFTRDEATLYSSTANGTVHIFDLNHLSALENGSQAHSLGSSFASNSSHKSGTSASNGGYASSLDNNMAFIQSPPQSSGSYSQQHVPSLVASTAPLYMSAGSANESTFHQYGVLSSNVPYFLSITRPNMRVLQGYSDVRVKLPLSDHHHQTVEHGDHSSDPHSARSVTDGPRSDEETSFGSSIYPQEVNLLSSSILSPLLVETSHHENAANGLNNNSFELLSATSEGILSRFRVSLSSGQSSQSLGGSIISNLMSQHQPVKEVNRWDLSASIATDSRHHRPFSLARRSHMDWSDGSPVPVCCSHSQWLGAGDDDEPIASPVWLRPQVRLFELSSDSSGISYKSNSSNNSNSNQIGNRDTKSSSSAGASKKKKPARKSKEKGVSISPDSDESAAASSEDHDDLHEESKPKTKPKPSVLLFFPEQQSSKHLPIQRPSMFVGTNRSASTADDECMLENDIQMALGDRLGGSGVEESIPLPVVKHSLPPEDISTWQMDDDWGQDDDQANTESIVGEMT